MLAKTAIDGDTGEAVELDGEVHCFIVRLGDDLFERLIEHQARLRRVLRRKVSRAEAARELIGRTLPRVQKRRENPNQTDLFGKPLRRDPLVAVEARQVADRAAAKLIGRE